MEDKLRCFLCWTLVLFQIVTPTLCHEHAAAAGQPSSEHGPHLHLHHILFWPIDHDDEDQHEDDHDADALYVSEAIFRGMAPRLAGEPLLPLEFSLAVCWPELNPPLTPPDPVALSPPAAGFFPLACPIYLSTLTLRC